MAKTKKSKKKRNAKIYWFCLAFYGILLCAAAAYGLKLAWQYAEEYEQSQPGIAINSYVDTLNETLWGDSIQAAIASMPHEVQTDEEVAEHVKALLQDGVSYVRKPGSGSGTVTYSLRCNNNTFGSVTLVEDESYKDKMRFGMLPWKVEREEFDFNGLYSSVEVVAPRSFSVYLNDIKLSSEYIIEENIPYDVLEDYYDQFDGLPSKVRYKFDHIIGKLEPVIKDEEGNVFTIDPNRDDSQFIKDCAEEKLARLEQFTTRFIDRYITYTSGVGDPMYTYSQLMPYLKKGSDIDERMKDAMDGLSWAHTISCKVNSAVLNGALDIGDGYYILDMTGEATTFAMGHGEEQKLINAKVVVVDENDDVRAIALKLY